MTGGENSGGERVLQVAPFSRRVLPSAGTRSQESSAYQFALTGRPCRFRPKAAIEIPSISATTEVEHIATMTHSVV